MKKLFLLFGALSLMFALSNTHQTFAEEASEKVMVCHFEENEEGELVEVCEEEEITPYIFCTPECWDE